MGPVAAGVYFLLHMVVSILHPLLNNCLFQKKMEPKVKPSGSSAKALLFIMVLGHGGVKVTSQHSINLIIVLCLSTFEVLFNGYTSPGRLCLLLLHSSNLSWKVDPSSVNPDHYFDISYVISQ